MMGGDGHHDEKRNMGDALGIRSAAGIDWRIVPLIILVGAPLATAASEIRVIRVDHEGNVVVESIDEDQAMEPGQVGLVVWSPDGTTEYCQSLSRLDAWPGPSTPAETTPFVELSAVRGGTRGDTSSGPVGFLRDIRVEQLATGTLTRAALLVSPRHNAELLDGRAVFRRLPEGTGDQAYP